MMNIETFENYPLLKDCFEKQIQMKEEADKERTAANYQSAWNKFSSFLGRRRSEGMTAGTPNRGFRLCSLPKNLLRLLFPVLRRRRLHYHQL